MRERVKYGDGQADRQDAILRHSAAPYNKAGIQTVMLVHRIQFDTQLQKTAASCSKSVYTPAEQRREARPLEWDGTAATESHQRCRISKRYFSDTQSPWLLTAVGERENTSTLTALSRLCFAMPPDFTRKINAYLQLLSAHCPPFSPPGGTKTFCFTALLRHSRSCYDCRQNGRLCK